jgi:hypothetical protein
MIYNNLGKLQSVNDIIKSNVSNQLSYTQIKKSID